MKCPECKAELSKLKLALNSTVIECSGCRAQLKKGFSFTSRIIGGIGGVVGVFAGTAIAKGGASFIPWLSLAAWLALSTLHSLYFTKRKVVPYEERIEIEPLSRNDKIFNFLIIAVVILCIVYIVEILNFFWPGCEPNCT